MSEKKKYLPRQGMSGSSGFRNYAGGNPKPEEVWKDFPDGVIINGEDDWGAKEQYRPATFVPDLLGEKAVLAYYHTGISGMAFSGVVIDRRDLLKLQRRYKAEYGEYLGVTRRTEKGRFGQPGTPGKPYVTVIKPPKDKREKAA